MKTLVVDGTNLTVRSMKMAEKMNQLSAVVEGVTINTTGVFVFIGTLTRYVREEQPNRIIVCFDGGRSRYRLSIDPSYKSSRAERVPDEEEQMTFKLAKEFLTLNGIHHVSVPGVEADDLVAAYVRAREQEDLVVILSGDKDFLQLLSPKVSQIRPKSNPEKWTVETVVEKFGAYPEHMAKVQALTGDTADDIPGVPGFGTKTAVKYLKKYDWSMEKLLTAYEPKLIGMEARVWVNLALISLDPIQDGEFEGGYVPLFDDDPATTPLRGPLAEWFHKYDMGSLVSRLEAGVLWREGKLGKVLGDR